MGVLFWMSSLILGIVLGLCASLAVVRLRRWTSPNARVPAPLFALGAVLGGVMGLFVAFHRWVFMDGVQETIFFIVAFTVLLVLVLFDARFQMLPIEYMIGCGLMFFLWNGCTGRVSWISLLTGVLFGVGFLALQVVISRGRWMGAGDPYLGGMMGAILGWPFIGIAYYFAYMAGGILACVYLFRDARHRGSMRIPFAPLLTLGAIATFWFGGACLAWIVERLP